MRPIDKGTVPLVNGTSKVVNDYKNWREDLLDRLGDYCCYCNMPLSDSPQVEHVIAQNLGGSVTDWDNMLLACGACNRAKSDKPCPNTTHYLPDYHNTHLAFTHTLVEHPRRNNTFASFLSTQDLPESQHKKAKNTIDLCKLDVETTRIANQVTDLRWKFRFEAHLDTKLWRENWNEWGNTKQQKFITLLLTTAKARGFWSIWFDAFKDVASIRESLVTQFSGTHQASFDAQFNPIPRNSGDL